MNLKPALYRSALPRLQGDLCGLAAQRVALQTVTIGTGAGDFPADGVERPLLGIELDGWFADRCTVEVFGVTSRTGGELRLRLVVANNCGDETAGAPFLEADNRGVNLGANTSNRTLSVYTASGPLGSFWVILGNMVAPGDVVTFTAAFTLDRAGGGLYVVNGSATKA